MSELNDGFQSLPPEYQRVLQLAQDRHQLSIAPLQTLVGGWSGAMVFLVSVTTLTDQRVEHLILKLDRKSKTARTDEKSRHALAQSKSPAEFGRDHFATLAFEGVEADGAIAIFYSIAGQSLQSFRPLSNYGQQQQLEAIFSATSHYLLSEWNPAPSFATLQPRELLHRWLGFRLDAGAPIENFVRQVCKADPERPGFLIQGNVYPNPLWYARQPEAWGNARPIDSMLGLQHGDLNTNNILVKFSPDGNSLSGYYLIDFALFKDDMPLLYDLRYLEMSYLTLSMSQAPAKTVDLILSEGTGLDPRRAPVEMAGVGAVIASAREAFDRWVLEHHPSLQDDLWGQYWLAGVAAGLTYCHKAGMDEAPRLAGLIYAAANLKRYCASFAIPLPTDVQPLYSAERSVTGFQGTPPAGKAHHNLPAEPTRFIGREAQIAALQDLILDPNVRLVTLLGPGGAGKTRLSLQVAQRVLDRFSQGVIFVPLADDTDTNQFISRVAQQLEVREGGRPVLENIKDYLRDKRMLLIFDNFEQLVSAAPIVGELVGDAPQLKILVSSRVPLKLRSEYEFPVPPLDLPPVVEAQTVEELAGSESVLLFVERARAVQAGFALTAENALVIAEICRRLDGLPLAIELAAARLKLLPPRAILRRLEDSLKLLTGGARDLPSRQQTLRNTLEWSYSLLTEAEKTLFARLSVFVGGFTLEAAEAVCNPDGVLDLLEGVTSLVNNSLLRQDDPADGEPRFAMLETIRAYALERLAAGGEMEIFQAKHAAYFGDFIFNRIGLQLYTAQAPHWLNWLEREHDNIRATLGWCIAAPEGIELGVDILFVLFWFWYRRGYLIEGRRWAEQFVASPSLTEPSQHRATALLACGMLALWQGEQETALARLQETMNIEYRLEDDFRVAGIQMTNAIAYINMGRDEDAKPMLESAQAQFEAMGLTPFQAFTLVHLGNVELGLGNIEQARARHEEGLSLARSMGESWMISFALNNLGEVARTQGQYELARKYYEECENLLHDTGDRGDQARFVHSLGYIAQHEGDHARAESQFRKSLAMFRRLGNRRGMAECMAGLAGLRARQGEAEWGAIMLSAAESVLKETGGAWWPADRVEVEANQEILHAALHEAELEAAQAKGRAMTLEQALAFATERR